MKILKNMLIEMFHAAMRLNKENILSLLEPDPEARLLDLGCDDGEWSVALARKVGTKHVFGLDIVPERLELAKQKGVETILGDLNKVLPYQAEMFDVVHANQVIEHIANLDLFASEIARILKPGGYVIISTENASSWHNIFASVMGWQMFSLTNLSMRKSGLGNPLALHRDTDSNTDFDMTSWTHKVIFGYLGLHEFLGAHGFDRIQTRGAGYYPLPAFFGSLDKRHSHFIALKGFKKAKI